MNLALGTFAQSIVAYGSTNMSQADENSEQSCSEKKSKKTKAVKKQPKKERQLMEHKDSMSLIEKDLKRIKKACVKPCDAKKAMDELKVIEDRVKKLIKNLKQSEKHGAMWEVHEHTLNRKVRETREYIEKKAQA